MTLGFTVGIPDCHRLLLAVQGAGGTIPAELSRVLACHDLLGKLGAGSDPARSIVAAARTGDPDADRLKDLLSKAAIADVVADYAAQLRGRSERLFLEAFHEALEDGCADLILNSMRPAYAAAAAAVDEARGLVPAETPAEKFLTDASPEAIAAWQGLDAHINRLNAIGLVAALFGPRGQKFSLIDEYALADGHLLHDRAIFCSTGELVNDSQIFNSPGTHRASPWFRVGKHLHTVESARQRYASSLPRSGPA